MSEPIRIFNGISQSKEFEVLVTAAKKGKKIGIPATEYHPERLQENLRNNTLHILVRTSLTEACIDKGVMFPQFRT